MYFSAQFSSPGSMCAFFGVLFHLPWQQTGQEFPTRACFLPRGGGRQKLFSSESDKRKCLGKLSYKLANTCTFRGGDKGSWEKCILWLWEKVTAKVRACVWVRAVLDFIVEKGVQPPRKAFTEDGFERFWGIIFRPRQHSSCLTFLCVLNCSIK